MNKGDVWELLLKISNLEAENAQLKAEVQQSEVYMGRLDLLEENDRQWKKFSLIALLKERDQLKAQLEQCKQERDNWRAIAEKGSHEIPCSVAASAAGNGGRRDATTT